MWQKRAVTVHMGSQGIMLSHSDLNCTVHVHVHVPWDPSQTRTPLMVFCPPETALTFSISNSCYQLLHVTTSGCTVVPSRHLHCQQNCQQLPAAHSFPAQDDCHTATASGCFWTHCGSSLPRQQACSCCGGLQRRETPSAAAEDKGGYPCLCSRPTSMQLHAEHHACSHSCVD